MSGVTSRRNSSYPFLFFSLFLHTVLIPLVLHILQERLSVHTELFTLRRFPLVNLSLQTLLELTKQTKLISIQTIPVNQTSFAKRAAQTFGKLFCRSTLCFSSFSRFPPLLLKRDGSVAFFWRRKSNHNWI